jgi:hypothetical protein
LKDLSVNVPFNYGQKYGLKKSNPRTILIPIFHADVLAHLDVTRTGLNLDLLAETNLMQDGSYDAGKKTFGPMLLF